MLPWEALTFPLRDSEKQQVLLFVYYISSPPHNSNLVIVAAGNDLSFTTYAIWLHRVAKDSAPSVLSPPHVRKNDRDLVNLSAQDTGNSDSHRQCISALRCATPPCSPALEM